MAPGTSPALESDGDLLPIEQILFSCCICQASPSEVYARTESHKGFHSGSSHDNGIVTKMWIATCSHIICSEHLKDGAMPIHSKESAPQAACPRCIEDHGDQTVKQMYAIHGLQKGEYDAVIPSEWLQSPPMKLDVTVPGMGAVRFQYIVLSNYARHVKLHWSTTQRKLSLMESALSRERKAKREVERQVVELQSRVASLEKSEAKLKKWESKKDVIYHSLGQVEAMVTEIEMLRRHLRQLGYDHPHQKYTFEPSQPNSTGERRPTTSPTAGNGAQESARDLAKKSPRLGEAISSSSQKRKHEDMEGPSQYEDANVSPIKPRMVSRDMMPPPLPSNYPKRQEHRKLGTRIEGIPPQTLRPPAVNLVRDEPADSRLPVREQGSRRTAVPCRSSGPVYDRFANGIEDPMSRESPHRHSQADRFNTFPRTRAASGMDQSFAGVKPFSRLSINSPTPQIKTSNQQVYGPLGGTPQELGFQKSGLLDSRNGQVSTQATSPWHYQPFDPANQRFDRSRAPPKTPFPQKPSEAIPMSAQSPFFKRHGLDLRPPTMRRPPTRGSMVSRTSERDQSHQAALQYQPQDISGTERYSMSTSSLAQRVEQPCRDSGQRAYPAQFHGYEQNYRQPSRPPPFPSSTPGTVHRSQTPRQQYSKNTSGYQGRITLPPSHRSSMVPRATQDTTLSQITGVRGLASRGGVSQSRAGGSWGLTPSHGSRHGLLRQ